jgi:hypothetical protein
MTSRILSNSEQQKKEGRTSSKYNKNKNKRPGGTQKKL